MSVSGRMPRLTARRAEVWRRRRSDIFRLEVVLHARAIENQRPAESDQGINGFFGAAPNSLLSSKTGGDTPGPE
jgi:hypothetical protein